MPGLGEPRQQKQEGSRKGREARVTDPNFLPPTLLTAGTTKDPEVDQPKGKLRNREQAEYGPSN